MKKLVLEEAEQMYKDTSQLRIEDFVFPYGEPDSENGWVKLAELVSWDRVPDIMRRLSQNLCKPPNGCKIE